MSVVIAQTDTATAANPFRLDQVVVTATKTEHKLGDVTVAAEVISQEEIAQRQLKTVADALIRNRLTNPSFPPLVFELCLPTMKNLHYLGGRG